MINWIKEKLGLCVHEWGEWQPVVTAAFSLAGHRRWCRKCGKGDNAFYPDGH